MRRAKRKVDDDMRNLAQIRRSVIGPICEIRIEFDRPDACYPNNSYVSGQIVMEARKRIVSKCLFVGGIWKASGKRIKHAVKYEQIVAPFRTMQAGELCEVPYRIRTPSGPPSYHGHLLNVHHYVRVRVEFLWVFVLSRNNEYFLVPTTQDEVPPRPYPEGKELNRKKNASDQVDPATSRPRASQSPIELPMRMIGVNKQSTSEYPFSAGD